MQIKFSINVTEVFNEDGESIPTENDHYKEAAEAFIEDNKDGAEHEVETPDGTRIMFEMEDIEIVK